MKPESLLQLYEFIARGLAFHHWGLMLPPDSCIVHGEFLSAAGAKIFERLFACNARNRLDHNLGDGVFTYIAAQAVDPPEFTVWRMSFYAAALADNVAGEDVTSAYVLTAPKQMKAANEFIRLLRHAPESPSTGTGR